MLAYYVLGHALLHSMKYIRNPHVFWNTSPRNAAKIELPPQLSIQPLFTYSKNWTSLSIEFCHISCKYLGLLPSNEMTTNIVLSPKLDITCLAHPVTGVEPQLKKY
jgi:hypothetical protein